MGKRIKTLLTVLAVSAMTILGTCVSASAETVTGVTARAAYAANFYVGETLYVNASTLNLRESESTNSKIITSMYRGEEVTVVAVDNTYGWVQVMYEAERIYKGWCAAQYLTSNGGGGSSIHEYSYGKNYIATVLTDELPVYTSAEAIRTNGDYLEYGWVVDALAYTDNGYVKVRYYVGKKTNTHTGYVRNRHLSIKKASSPSLPDDEDEDWTTLSGRSGVSTVSGLTVHYSLNFSGNDVKALTVVPYGTEFRLISQSPHWYKVKFKYNGKVRTCYVWREYVKKKDAFTENIDISNIRLDMSVSGDDPFDEYRLSIIDNIDSKTTQAFTKKVTWKSSNKKVAKVSSKGKVTALKAGYAKITATVKIGSRSKKYYCRIYVTDDDDDDDDM